MIKPRAAVAALSVSVVAQLGRGRRRVRERARPTAAAQCGRIGRRVPEGTDADVASYRVRCPESAP